MTGSNSTPEGEPARRLSRVRLAGLAAALLTAILLAWIGEDATSRALFDRYQRLAPAPARADAVRVVLIDPESLEAVGPWPWPRYLVARLTEEIAARGAVAIGFDMIFPEPDRLNPDRVAALYPELPSAARAALRTTRSQDEVLAEVVGANPVVLARVGIEGGAVDFAAGAQTDSAHLPVAAGFTAPLPASVATYPGALANIADLDEVGAGQALINGTPDRDGVVRRVPLVAKVAGAPTPGFALDLARVTLGAETIAPVTSGGRLRAVALGGQRVPVDADGRMRLRFGPLPPRIVTSAALLLRRGWSPDAFRGKIVIVGLGAAGTADVVTTPTERETYGTFVQARAANAILGGGALSRPAWAGAAEWAAAALLTALATLLFPRLRGVMIALVPLGLTGVTLALSFAAFARGDLLLDPLRPLLVGATAAVTVAAMLFVEQTARQRRLRATLADERVASARAAGELEAAREIQLGMLPVRERLGTLDPTVDLDAWLEPARSVGGDFYDAIPLSGGRLCVLVGDVTGKGVPAALFMALSRALSKSVLLRQSGDLATAMTQLDAELARDNRQDMFVTMLVAVLDTRDGTLSLCNAGHENPLRATARGTVEEVTLDGGPPLCVVGGFPYPVETIRLSPGDGVVLVSDGLTEAQNATGDFFGRERALATLTAWSGDISAREATRQLGEAVRAFEAGADPTDDLTILALRWRGPADAA